MKPILCLVLACLFVACSSDEKKGKSEAEVLYKEALELIESERYILATEKLQTIKTQHPYSFYATPAELLLAEVQFKQESYPEAAASFLLFRDFHPRHEKIGYVVFMIAESYYKQLPPTIDRDLDTGVEALKFYDEYVAKYPKGEKVRTAKKRVKRINEMLREKDLYIADFYFKTKVWEAAKYWYVDILSRHAAHEKLRQHAMLRVVESAYHLKKWQECQLYAEKFSPLVDNISAKTLRSWEDRCRKKLK